jgi:hypothetical protein
MKKSFIHSFISIFLFSCVASQALADCPALKGKYTVDSSDSKVTLKTIEQEGCNKIKLTDYIIAKDGTAYSENKILIPDGQRHLHFWNSFGFIAVAGVDSYEGSIWTSMDILEDDFVHETKYEKTSAGIRVRFRCLFPDGTENPEHTPFDVIYPEAPLRNFSKAAVKAQLASKRVGTHPNRHRH